MSRRGTLPILLVIFAALAVLVMLTSQQPVPITELEATVEATEENLLLEGSLIRLFPDLAVLDMEALRLEDLVNNHELTLVRASDGSWTAPNLEGELDVDAVSSIARTLALLPYGRSVNILTDTDFTDYGLAPRPRFLFQIIKTDDTSHVIAVGSLTEAGHAYYALVDERDEIFQVERGPIDFLTNLIYPAPIRLTN